MERKVFRPWNISCQFVLKFSIHSFLLHSGNGPSNAVSGPVQSRRQSRLPSIACLRQTCLESPCRTKNCKLSFMCIYALMHSALLSALSGEDPLKVAQIKICFNCNKLRRIYSYEFAENFRVSAKKIMIG